MKGMGGLGQIVVFNQMLVLGCMVSFSLPALADSDPNVCRGVDFDIKRPLVASRISARPHVNFVKGADDDAACPADNNACRKKAYLVPGDLVLTSRAHRASSPVLRINRRIRENRTGQSVGSRPHP